MSITYILIICLKHFEESKVSFFIGGDNMFKKIHGQIKVYYTVIGREVTIDNISPTELLNEGADRMLEVYKGVIIASPRDKFKVDLYLNIKKGE